MGSRYQWRSDAIASIENALDEFANEFDVDAIFDEVFEWDAAQSAFVEACGPDDFWDACMRHELNRN